MRTYQKPNSPTFLGLPLETRQHIFSYCLINNRVLDMVTDDMRRRVRPLLLTNRQLHDEATEFFYAKNTFALSLISPSYTLTQRPPHSSLPHRLSLVQNLHLHVSTTTDQRLSTAIGDTRVFFPNITNYPKQGAQWYWFLFTLVQVKAKSQSESYHQEKSEDGVVEGGEDEEEGTVLNLLRFCDEGLLDGEVVIDEEGKLPLFVVRDDQDVAPYSWLLGDVRDRIGRLEIDLFVKQGEKKAEDEVM